jgi:hypothetical protein
MNGDPKPSRKSNVRGHEYTGSFEIIVEVSAAYNFQSLPAKKGADVEVV